MPVIEPVIRPPGEAYSFLLQITTGCSCNSCSFCGAYRGKPFTVKDFDEIRQDIKQGAKYYPDSRRVFLMDGDALVLTTDKLLPVLEELNKAFPALKRISSYANDFNINLKTAEELSVLRARKLSLIYMGLESGSQNILDSCGKKSTVEGMIEAVRKAGAAGIKSSVIGLLGLGGKEKSKIHTIQTAEALNQMQPDQLSLLSLMLIPGTNLHKAAEQEKFKPLSQEGFLSEMYEILKRLELKRTIFHSNHASNYLSLSGRLPQDKFRFLTSIKEAMENKSCLRPEWLRDL